MNLQSLSKFLSYLLRHHPQEIGLSVDDHGWARVDDLIEKAKRHGKELTRDQLCAVINHGEKQRFILTDDEQFIRAGYGHSIDVDLQLRSKAPPEILFHGTAKKNVDAILAGGLHSRSRNFVHLSAQKADAKQVGGRHGSPVILEIRSAAMWDEDHEFYQSESEPDIWLTKRVPPEYLCLSS
jgi:putative RNA 2'-phosphotransferase